MEGEMKKKEWVDGGMNRKREEQRKGETIGGRNK